MGATKDFEFVLRVLNSSENSDHIKTTDKLFENFKNKWKRRLGQAVLPKKVQATDVN